MVIPRQENEWHDLLGLKRIPLLEELIARGKTTDFAGYHIWCALEALRKASNMQGQNLAFDSEIDDCVIFKEHNFTIITFPLKLLRGRERMVAIAINEAKPKIQQADKRQYLSVGMSHFKWGALVAEGPQKQHIFSFQFPLSLSDNATTTGGVYFSVYFSWLGKLREMTLEPISQYIADLFFNGIFMVTNFTKTRFIAEVRNDDVMDARVWIDKISGPEKS